MIAISLWEPWATAIALDLKKIETRGWQTHYRGPLAIHAAKTRAHADFIYYQPYVQEAFAAAGITSHENLNFGCVVARCYLVDCVPTGKLLDEGKVSDLEFLMGNYESGRFGWVLADVQRLAKPVPARGSQGFWNWEPQ